MQYVFDSKIHSIVLNTKCGWAWWKDCWVGCGYSWGIQNR